MMKLFIPAALLLGLSQLLSRALGVVRDHVFASYFGATGGEGLWNIDTYYAAFRLPDLVYNLLVFGAVSAAFLPLLTEKRGTKNKDEFTNNVLHTLLLGLLAVSAVVFIFAVPFASLIAPGFSETYTTQTAQLLQIQLLAPIFFAVSAVFAGLAQHANRFTWYALAPLFYNASIIAAAVFFAEEYGVVALAWGTVIGAGLHAAIQLPGIVQAKFRWRPVLEPAKLGAFFRLATPRIAAIGASQFQLILITVFASIVGTGALAVFNYAWNLASLPFGIIGLAVATVSFAQFAKLAKTQKAFAAAVTDRVTSVLFFALPAAMGLFLLREELTMLILGFGQFSDMDIVFTAEAVGILAVAVPFLSVMPVLNNAFFAQKNTYTPLVAGMMAVLVTVVVCWTTIDIFEATGLAMGFAAAAVVSVSYLLYRFRRQAQLHIGASVARMVGATVVLGALLAFLGAEWQPQTWGETALYVASMTGLGAAVYFAMAELLGLPVRHFIRS